MYGLCGVSQNIRSVYRLAAPFVGPSKVKTTFDLKPSYIQFLNGHQPDYATAFSNELIVQDRITALQLIGSFSASRINDLHQEKMIGDFYDSNNQESCNERVESAIQSLHDYNPEISELLRLAIHSIVLCGSNLNEAGLKAHGGTSSRCIGLMWLTMKGDLSSQDVMELLIHELTHTLVFVDELNYKHFDYSHLTLKENWARSSILNRLRPMDKVIHSIVVAHEILFARANFLPNVEKPHVHPADEVLKKNVLAAIDSVFAHPNHEKVCKPRALELIEKVGQNVRAL